MYCRWSPSRTTKSTRSHYCWRHQMHNFKCNFATTSVGNVRIHFAHTIFLFLSELFLFFVLIVLFASLSVIGSFSLSLDFTLSRRTSIFVRSAKWPYVRRMSERERHTCSQTFSSPPIKGRTAREWPQNTFVFCKVYTVHYKGKNSKRYAYKLVNSEFVLY